MFKDKACCHDGFSNRLSVIEIVLQLQTYLVIISSPETHKEELVTNLIFEKRT